VNLGPGDRPTERPTDRPTGRTNERTDEGFVRYDTTWTVRSETSGQCQTCPIRTGREGNLALTLARTCREADCSTGYSPMLSFDVLDMDETIARLMGLGARLDGPIKYPIQGKVASIRSPCGHMLGLFEPNPDLP